MSEVELVRKLHESETFLPSEGIESSIKRILVMATILYIIHFLSLAFVGKTKINLDDDDKPILKYKDGVNPNQKTAFYAVNMVVNAVLGFYGFWCFMNGESMLQKSIDEIINGMPDFTIFGEIQLAFQAYTLPVGILLINEDKIMLLHHFLVIGVSFTCTFCTNGSRPQSPFFFGLIELR